MDEQLRRNNLQATFVSLLNDLAPTDGDFIVAEDVSVYRRSAPTALHHGESSICFCAIAQGAKQVEIGELQYTYTPNQILMTSIELPMVSHVVEASEDRPYLSFSLNLNPGLVRSVLMASDPAIHKGETDICALCVYDLDIELLDAVVRLMRAVQNRAETSFLVPMIKQEIVFRLLLTHHAGRLRQIAGMSTVSNQITNALDHLRTNFSEPLRVADIATSVGMSVSTFHEHFKRVTGLTPVQYQKQLRLREARHRLLTEDMDATEAGYSVGYTDPSHFNRDYKRMFGLPPRRDVAQMRDSTKVA